MNHVDWPQRWVLTILMILVAHLCAEMRAHRAATEPQLQSLVRSTYLEEMP
jgi:hypothetical protein